MVSAVRAAFLVVVCLVPALCAAQDLTPRAYLPLPVSSNAVVLTYAFSDGELLFDPTLPITDATGTIHAPVVSYYHAFDFFGRSANITGVAPVRGGRYSREAEWPGARRLTARAWRTPSCGWPSTSWAARRSQLAEFVKTRPARIRVGRQREGRRADRPVRPYPC